MAHSRSKAPRRWRVLGLELPLGEEDAALRGIACEHLGIEPEELLALRLVRKSIDLRGRGRGRAPRWIVHVDVVLPGKLRSKRLERLRKKGRVSEAPPQVSLEVTDPSSEFRGGPGPRVVVVGAGPGGVFAALTMALAGARVSVLERGDRIDERSRQLARFHRTRSVDPESNLLFGEGGAGTYSDGKLYTRVDDPLEVPVLEELVRAGAREDILWDARAHIGTDRLHRVLPALRERLEELGVEFAWRTRFEGLVREVGREGRVSAVRTSSGELECDALILAIGHSAEDTWRQLHADGVAFEGKPFQLGVRVEHPQEFVDLARYGEPSVRELLGAANYNLVSRASEGSAGAHSFCMCPGGKIVASVNTPGRLCTNGMSNSTHSSSWANSALVTTYTPEHFGSDPFAGLEFRTRLETTFFAAGGSDYSAPAQRVPDFLDGRGTSEPGRCSYPFGVVPGRIDHLLPEPGLSALRRALGNFDQQMQGFAGPGGLLVGVESRSSGPVRLPRERSTREAVGWENLYAVGEGAGFAGGIMSAALDGVHAAQALIRKGSRVG